MEQLTLCEKNDDQVVEKLITPKARRLFPSLRFSKKYSSNRVEKMPKAQSVTSLDNISLEEINKDFLRYSQNIEDEKGQNELMNILCNSTKESSFDSQYHKKTEIERPENPFEKNFLFNNIDDDCYYSKVIEDNQNVNLGKIQ